MALGAGLAGNGGQSASVVSVSSQPSGDTTGATDTAKLTTVAAVAGTQRIGAGDYYISSTIAISPATLFDCGNAGEVRFHATSALTGPMFSIHDSTAGVWSASPPAVYAATNFSGLIGEPIIDGTSATDATAGGVEYGDIYKLRIRAHIQNFTGASSIGASGYNKYGWCERADVKITTDNCTTHFAWNFTAPGTSSFDYSDWDLSFRMRANQTGLSYSSSVDFLGGIWHIKGNAYGAVSNTGVVMSFGADGSSPKIRGGTWAFTCESDAGSSQQAPFNFAWGAAIGSSTPNNWGGVFQAAGVFNFQNSAGFANFQNGNLALPSQTFAFSGIANFTTSLGTWQTGEGLNVFGGTSWQKCSFSVSAGNLNLFPATGDFVNTATLANGANKLVIQSAQSNRARRLFLLLKQPASGAAGTLDITTPGNNGSGSAQTVTHIGGQSTIGLSTANGTLDLLELWTFDSINWYIHRVHANPLREQFADSALSVAVGLSNAYGASTAVPLRSGANGLHLEALAMTTASVSAETITLQITATFSDGSSKSATLTTASSGVVSANDATKVGLYNDGTYMTALGLQAKTSGASSTATVTVAAVGYAVR